MANLMKHGGYIASIEFDPEIGTFAGQLINTSDVITFYGSSVAELRREFANSIKAHVAFCKRKGISPSRPYSGKFNVRMAPEVHASVFAASHLTGKSMNAWVEETLRREAERVLEGNKAA
jgi:predicted HicB family RNase H-like nuclease